ncbi:MAG: hypothetical protein EHM20_02285 [Alphaproteobacteria bacterium]|nr:MAG: hypothetical protein EHM20_02285 [Alphaproteobacteria bacterium]
MKNKVLSAFLIFFLFVASVTVTSAGKEVQLTQHERLTSGISFSSNHVFWTESAGNDVHAYDLTTGKRTDINGHAADGQTHAHGNKVVWTGDMGDAVYTYDVSTGNETMIASERRAPTMIASERYGPDIYGNYIVYTNSNYYSDQDQKNNSIYLYDLNTSSETKIATVHGYPAIYDKTVVWSQANNSGGYDICMYDICTHQTSTITTTNSSSYESRELDIYGNVVVWIESGNLYMYDIATHKITQVTNSGNATDPAIYGKRIVYTFPTLFGTGDIYMYDISTVRTTRITTSALASSPSIYGDKIVYENSHNPESPEVRDIYLYDLKPKN